MNLNKLYHFLVLGMLLFSFGLYGQHKEYGKLQDLVDKGKLDKAQEYCDKVTAAMDSKTAARFYGLMGLAYYNKKDYTKSAEMLLKSEDKKTSVKVAKEFENEANDFFDLKIAGKLYRIAKEYEKAAGLLYKEGEYEEAARINPSPASNLKFGKELFDQGKYDEALYFFKRAKNKGEKFSDDQVLDHYYKSKAYSTAYSIQNSGEGNFNRYIQGGVIDKMFENNEPMGFIQHFLDSLGIKANKQDEAIIGSLVNVGMYDKAESYCMELKQGNQQIGLAFLADITANQHPGTSAWANLKTGKTLLGKQQITTYLVETALRYNSEWESEPVSHKLLEDYYKETQVIVKKCEQNYCEFIGFAWTMCNTKNSELSKQPDKAAEYAKASLILKQIELSYCRKK